MEASPKISLVLSSGGLKAAASIALFEWLREEGIKPDLIAGCSGGGIFGGMYALNYSAAEMIAITRNFLLEKGFSELDYQSLLGQGRLPGGHYDLSSGLFKDKKPLKWCRQVFGDHFIEDLPIQMLYQCTDIQKGAPVVLEKGSLAEAVYASAAMYPLLPPIYLEGRWLADGAFTSPLPITEVVKRGSDIIIAMLFNESLDPNPGSFLKSLLNINRITAQSIVKSQLAMAIELHHYELIPINVHFNKYISYSDPSNLETIVKAGKLALDTQKEEILQAINNFHKLKL